MDSSPAAPLRPHMLFAGVPLVIAACVLGAYFVNYPHAMVEFDSANNFGTPTYIGAAQDILRGHVFSTGRLPGYPMLLALLGATHGFYALVVGVQAVLFLVTVAVTYVVAWRCFAERWIAAVVALLMAADLYAAAYAKEILSEMLAMAVLAGLTAFLVSFAERPRRRTIWIVAAFATALTFTRPEWVFLPLGLAIYLALWRWRRPFPRGVTSHALAALVAAYAVVGVYVAGNAVFNGYAGMSEINNISVLGKAMQYDMLSPPPPGYAAPAAVVEDYLRVKHLNVWHVVIENPSFAADHYALSGRLGTAAIRDDPLKFVGSSVALIFTHNADVDTPLLHVMRTGPLRLPLTALARYNLYRYAFYWLLPAFGVVAALFPLFSRARRPPAALGPVAVISLYGAAIIAFGGFDEYGRYHTVYLAATNVLVWGLFLHNVVIAARSDRWVGMLAALVVLVEIGIVLWLALAPSAAGAIVATAAVALLQGGLLWVAGLRTAAPAPA